MSGPERRTVRVRRSPRIGVFLAIGAVAGALLALVATSVLPQDPRLPVPQAFGLLVLLLAPAGALVAGLVAVVVEAVLDRRTREVEAERITPAADEGQDRAEG